MICFSMSLTAWLVHHSIVSSESFLVHLIKGPYPFKFLDITFFTDPVLLVKILIIFHFSLSITNPVNFLVQTILDKLFGTKLYHR